MFFYFALTFWHESFSSFLPQKRSLVILLYDKIFHSYFITDVIENIKNAAEAGNFSAKVEVDDPCLSEDEGNAIALGYMENRGKAMFKFKTLLARTVATVGGGILNRDTKIVGIEKLDNMNCGAIITSNHFFNRK